MKKNLLGILTLCILILFLFSAGCGSVDSKRLEMAKSADVLVDSESAAKLEALVKAADPSPKWREEMVLGKSAVTVSFSLEGRTYKIAWCETGGVYAMDGVAIEQYFVYANVISKLNTLLNASYQPPPPDIKETYTVRFLADSGGSINGNAVQTVDKFGTTTGVQAVPDEGYEFIGWSDGVEAASRQLTNVQSDMTLTARFCAIEEFEEGTSENPFIIETIEQLNSISSASAHYRLGADLTFPDNENNFVPLFSDENMFVGSFDGAGYTIKNIRLYSEDAYYLGFFACIGEGGLVKNLQLVDYSANGNYFVGGIAARSLGMITDCQVFGTIKSLKRDGVKMSFFGGIVGRNEGSVTRVKTSITVMAGETGEVYAGGLIGYSVTELKMENCVAMGDVTGKDYSGGLIGYCDRSVTMTNCYATGNVTGSNGGGLIGRSSTVEMINCYATGDVTGYIVGGLTGDGSRVTMTNCYATGAVNGKSGGGSVGGLIGSCYDIDMTDCYATGIITYKSNDSLYNSSYAGGLVGSVSNLTMNRVYFSGILSGETSTLGGLVGGVSSYTAEKAFWRKTDTVKYGVGEDSNLGIPTSAGTTGLTTSAQFETLASLLNEGLEVPVWKNVPGKAPILIDGK